MLLWETIQIKRRRTANVKANSRTKSLIASARRPRRAAELNLAQAIAAGLHIETFAAQATHNEVNEWRSSPRALFCPGCGRISAPTGFHIFARRSEWRVGNDRWCLLNGGARLTAADGDNNRRASHVDRRLFESPNEQLHVAARNNRGLHCFCRLQFVTEPQDLIQMRGKIDRDIVQIIFGNSGLNLHLRRADIEFLENLF